MGNAIVAPLGTVGPVAISVPTPKVGQLTAGETYVKTQGESYAAARECQYMSMRLALKRKSSTIFSHYEGRKGESVQGWRGKMRKIFIFTLSIIIMWVKLPMLARAKVQQ